MSLHRSISALHHMACPLAISSLLLCLLWLLPLPAANAAQSQPEALGSIRGTVRDAQGDPLANINVWLEHQTDPLLTRRVSSDSTGGYHLAAVPSGIYRLRFEDPANHYATHYYLAADFGDEATTVAVNGNHISDVDMQLHLGGALTVTLDNAQPVTPTYYSVLLYRQAIQGGWRIYREAQLPLGQQAITFSGLPTGTYHLCALATSFNPADGLNPDGGTECYNNVLPAQYRALAPDATPIQIQANTPQSVSMTLNDVSQIEGYLLTPDDQPLAGSPVLLYYDRPLYGLFREQLVHTNAEGYFRFAYIPTERYGLILNAASGEQNAYLPIYYPNEPTPATQETLLITPSSRISITRKVRAASSLVGQVTLANDAPLHSAEIIVFRQRADGSWHEYWNCYLYCAKPRYDTATGVFTATHLIAGNYRIGVGYALPLSQASRMTYFGGDSLESATDIGLGSGATKQGLHIMVGEESYQGAISGRVTADGQPVAGIEAGLFSGYFRQSRDHPMVTTLTDEEGYYQIDGLIAGDYLLGFRDPNGKYATVFYPYSSTAHPNTEAMLLSLDGAHTLEDINVDLSLGSTIRGRIRTQPLASPGGMMLQVVQHMDALALWIPNVPYITARSDANGFYTISGLRPGFYYLRAIPPAGSGEFSVGVARYYPGEYNPWYAQGITVGPAETIEDVDIYFYLTPTSFLPQIIDKPTTPIPYTPEPAELTEPPAAP